MFRSLRVGSAADADEPRPSARAGGAYSAGITRHGSCTPLDLASLALQGCKSARCPDPRVLAANPSAEIDTRPL